MRLHLEYMAMSALITKGSDSKPLLAASAWMDWPRGRGGEGLRRRGNV